MIHLARLTKQSFKGFCHNKKGEVFIEASIAMPLACVISIMMLQLAVIFFNELEEQVKEHISMINEKSYMIQIEILRKNEKFIQ